jgi:hypothetical protein
MMVERLTRLDAALTHVLRTVAMQRYGKLTQEPPESVPGALVAG